MNDAQPTVTPHDGRPTLIAELISEHAESLLQYCWIMLGDDSAAQAALRRALLAAAHSLSPADHVPGDPQCADHDGNRAYSGRPADSGYAGHSRCPGYSGRPAGSGSPREWLFSLAHAQCLRERTPVAAGAPPGGDPALMATHAMMSLSQPAREAVALTAWHGMTNAGTARIVGATVAAVAGLVQAGREQLHRAVAGEVLAGRDRGECWKRAAILDGRPATLPAPLRDRLLGHAAACPRCGPHLPREVSAAKVCGLLPFPPMTDAPVADLPSAELATAAELAVALATDLRAARGKPVTGLGDLVMGSREPATSPREPATSPREPVTSPAGTAPDVAEPLSAEQRGPIKTGRRRSRAAGWFALVTLGMAVILLAASFLGLPGTGARPGSGGTTGPGASSDAPGKQRVPRTHERPVTGARSGPALTGLPQAARAGRLLVIPGTLSLGSATSGVIMIAAKDGPVTWSAASSSALVLSRRTGHLGAGQRAMLRVQVRPGKAGWALVRISPGGIAVRVTWTGPTPRTSSPSATPSADPSPTASATPTPSPSPSPSPSLTPSQSATPSPSGAPPLSPCRRS
jgi:hypothetical protein